ncbi:MAG: amino acid transporter [Chloroflexi bacterium]|nr:MAG: amino acid transporter [Chloroflexota bacterium]
MTNNNSTIKITLTRDMSLFDVTMIGVGAMIGAGIFVLTGIAADHAGPALLLVFFLNGLIALLTAASYAELGAAFPGAGGGYAWARDGLTPYLGFLAGWMSWFAQAMACSLYSLGFGSFAARLLKMAHISPFGMPDHALTIVLAASAAALFTLINYRGAAETGKIGNTLTLAKIAILVGLVLFGLKALPGNPNWVAEFTPFLPHGIGGVLVAMGLTAIAFEGYEIVAQSGEEVINPHRNVPRAIFLSIAIAVSIYLAVAFALLAAMQTPDGSATWQFLGAHAEQAVVEAADRLMPYGTIVLLIAGLMSTLSALNATLYSSSRVSFSMGRNRDLPDIFGQIHPQRHTPHWAVFFSGILVILMAVLLPIKDVASAADIMFMLLFMMVNVSLITLRRRRPDVDRPFKVPLMPLLPILGIVSQVVLSLYLFKLSPIAWYATLVWIGLGTLFYATYARRAEAMPEPVRVIHEEIVAVTGYSVLIPVANHSQARLLGIIGSAVARDRGGEVFALHVVRVPPQLRITDGRFFLRQGKPILETVIEEAHRRDAPVHTMIRLGRTAASAILETARERGTDLMVLGWPGYTETTDAAFGSVIDLVTKNPPCDLAVVRFRKREPPRCIMVPTSGGPHAALAIELAISQARQFKVETGEEATITLLYVLPDEADAVALAWARRMLTDVAAHYDYPLAQRVATAPDVVTGILEETKDCNLLLIGATGERMFEQRLFGSIPERVARESTKTVIMTKRYWRLKSLVGRVMKHQ